MYSVIDENQDKDFELHSILNRLEEIKLFLENELSLKQKSIEVQKEKIGDLKTSLMEKDARIINLQSQLDECRQTNEGTRQLINKLLQDISSYQKDIEWYKRTYQQRSLWGYLKERFK